MRSYWPLVGRLREAEAGQVEAAQRERDALERHDVLAAEVCRGGRGEVHLRSFWGGTRSGEEPWLTEQGVKKA